MLYRALLMPNIKQAIDPTPENDAMKALAAIRTAPTINNPMLILGGVPVPPFLNPNFIGNSSMRFIASQQYWNDGSFRLWLSFPSCYPPKYGDKRYLLYSEKGNSTNG